MSRIPHTQSRVFGLGGSGVTASPVITFACNFNLTRNKLTHHPHPPPPSPSPRTHIIRGCLGEGVNRQALYLHFNVVHTTRMDEAPPRPHPKHIIRAARPSTTTQRPDGHGFTTLEYIVHYHTTRPWSGALSTPRSSSNTWTRWRTTPSPVMISTCGPICPATDHFNSSCSCLVGGAPCLLFVRKAARICCGGWNGVGKGHSVPGGRLGGKNLKHLSLTERQRYTEFPSPLYASHPHQGEENKTRRPCSKTLILTWIPSRE